MTEFTIVWNIQQIPVRLCLCYDTFIWNIAVNSVAGILEIYIDIL